MMQSRDFYRNDYIFKYTKLATLNDFTEQMFNASRHQKQVLLLTQFEQQAQIDLFSTLTYLSLSALSLSLLSVIFYRKLPFLNRVEKKWKRILIKGTMLIVPVQIVSLYGQSQQLQLIEGMFGKHQSKLQDYMYTGDVKCLKPDIKISPV